MIIVLLSVRKLLSMFFFFNDVSGIKKLPTKYINTTLIYVEWKLVTKTSPVRSVWIIYWALFMNDMPKTPFLTLDSWRYWHWCKISSTCQKWSCVFIFEFFLSHIIFTTSMFNGQVFLVILDWRQISEFDSTISSSLRTDFSSQWTTVHVQRRLGKGGALPV